MPTQTSKRSAPPRIEACCAPIVEAPLGEAEAERLAAGFKVLADPTRLRLLSLLAAQPDGVCVCDLTGPLGLSQPTVSHHLRLLHAAGLVTRQRRGTFAYYAVEPGPLAVLRDALETGLTG